MELNYPPYLSLPPAYSPLWLQLKPGENGYPGYPPLDPDPPEAPPQKELLKAKARPRKKRDPLQPKSKSGNSQSKVKQFSKPSSDDPTDWEALYGDRLAAQPRVTSPLRRRYRTEGDMVDERPTKVPNRGPPPKEI